MTNPIKLERSISILIKQEGDSWTCRGTTYNEDGIAHPIQFDGLPSETAALSKLVEHLNPADELSRLTRENAELSAALKVKHEALSALVAAVKAEPAMNNRKYDSLGIQTNKALSITPSDALKGIPEILMYIVNKAPPCDALQRQQARTALAQLGAKPGGSNYVSMEYHPLG